MNTNVITSGAKVIIRDEKSAYDGMTGKVIVSQGKGKWLVRMALDNYQFVISGNNLDIANKAQPEDEVKAESAEYTTGTKPYVLHTILYKGGTEMKLKSESRTSHHVQIGAVAELLNEETAQLRNRNMELEAENAKMKEAIEEIFAMSDDLFGGHDELNEETHEENEEYLIAKLDSVREIAAGILYPKAPTVPAPESVTLSDAEIDWLAKSYEQDFKAYSFSQEVKDAPACVMRYSEDEFGYVHFRLEYKFNTPANRAAIESKRKELGMQP